MEFKVKILVDKEKCFMSESATITQLFKMDDEGYPEVLQNPLTKDLLKYAQEAVEVCPAVALKLEK